MVHTIYRIPRLDRCISATAVCLMPQAFSAVAKRYPDKIAIQDQAHTLSYFQVEHLIDVIAQHLLVLGLNKSDVVFIYGYRHYFLVLTILATLKIGATFSILDTRHPVHYLQTCLTKVKSKLVIDLSPEANERLLELVDNKMKLTLVQLQQLVNVSNKQSRKKVYPKILPDDNAVITFTSGTTNYPKVVLGRHSSLTHFYPWMDKVFGPFKNDRFAMCSNIAHDPIQRDIFTPLFFGATIVIPTDNDLFSPGKLVEWLATNKISVCCFTPSMCQLIFAASVANTTLKSLRLIFFVGESLLRSQVKQLKAIAPNARIINLYGSTETQRAVSYFELPQHIDQLSEEVVPLGKGMPGVELIILKRTRQLCGYNEIGEIYVRSPWISKGYLHASLKDKRRFIVNHLAHRSNDYMYRTGDLGFYDRLLGVRYAGRVDDQVKIEGHRVELQQINSVLRQYPDLNNAVSLMAKVDTTAHLIAFIVSNKSIPQKPVFLRAVYAYLKEQLPYYMIPKKIMLINKIPLTHNGKTDFKLLAAKYVKNLGRQPERYLSHNSLLSLSTVKVLSMLKTKLAEICACALDQIEVSRHINDYNIRSLFRLELLSFINQITDKSFSADVFADNPTIMQLARTISFRQRSTPKIYLISRQTPNVSRFWLKNQAVQEVSENHIRFKQQCFSHFCSNSYLGLGNHPQLKQEIIKLLNSSAGLGSHGSQLLNGSTIVHQELQATIAENYACQHVALFGSAYMANISTIPVIAQSGDHLLVDEYCHRSIIDACVLASGNIYVFKHNDNNMLESKLRQLKQSSKNKIIITEGVFSMNGDVSDLPSLRYLADRYGALLVVDEACSLGHIGSSGKGLEEYFNLPGAIDIRIGTLSKAVPSIGGYVAASTKYTVPISLQRGAIYSGALPILQAKIAVTALKIMHDNRSLITRLQNNARLWREGLRQIGFDVMQSSTAIVPIKTFDFATTKWMTQNLLKVHIYTFPVTYPWVEYGLERIRTTVTAAHTEEQIKQALHKMQPIAARLNARRHKKARF